MCASCLLGLALVGPEPDGPAADDFGAALVPETAYRVLTILATDHSGTTYLGEEDGTRRLVTLHAVRLEQPFDDAARQAFQHRAAALRRLAHPGIPPIIDVRQTAAGEGCVVAPFVNGPQIARYCVSSRLDATARARLFSLTCDTIAYAHGLGVRHGRLRPDAVILRLAEGEPPKPTVVGFSLFPGAPPGPAADLTGLESIARSMGWNAPGRGPWPSIEALRDAVCGECANPSQ